MKLKSILSCAAIAVLFLLAAGMNPASAESLRTVDTVSVPQWDGYMINNIIIDVEQAVVDNEANNSSDEKNKGMFTVWEWKNDDWTKVDSFSVYCGENNSRNFTAAGYKYNIEVRSVTKTSLTGSVFMTISSNMSSNDIYFTDIVKGGHAEVKGVGKPSLKITKSVNTTTTAVDDLIEVTVFVENTGSYDALNVTVNDQTQARFILMDTIINDTKIKTLESGSNRTVLMYRLKAAEAGSIKLADVVVTFSNGANQTYNMTYKSTPTVTVEEGMKDAPVISLTNTVNTTEMSTKIGKIGGTIIVRNTGTAAAENVRIDLAAQGLTLKGDNMSGDSVFITTVLPNNEKIIEYTASAGEPGVYRISSVCSYTYSTEKGTKTGEATAAELTVYAEEDKIISGISKIPVYIVIIPIILIALVAFFMWRRRREYKF